MRKPRHTSDVNEMRLIESYLIAHGEPVWVTHTPKTSAIGGFSARLVDSSGNRTWKVKIANGDVMTVDRREISMRLEKW